MTRVAPAQVIDSPLTAPQLDPDPIRVDDPPAVVPVPLLGLAGDPELYFQPAVDLATGRLLGFEALLRWQHPQFGLLMPTLVFARAEYCGQMRELNAWVLAEACRQAAGWSRELQLAVNCSVFQFRRHEAAEATATALALSKLDPQRLTLEVTELAVTDPEATADLLAVADLGVQLSVDDLGGSLPAIGQLPALAVNTVKIDRTLVAHLDTAESESSVGIVERIVTSAHELGLCVVAEGVERTEQVTVLRRCGADVAQGYFFSVPLPSTETTDLTAMEPIPVFEIPGMPAAGRDRIPTGSTTSRVATPRHARGVRSEADVLREMGGLTSPPIAPLPEPG